MASLITTLIVFTFLLICLITLYSIHYAAYRIFNLHPFAWFLFIPSIAILSILTALETFV